MSTEFQRLRVIDSHTGGEPTRVVIEGGPDFDGMSAAEVRTALIAEHDWVRTTCLHEPRGHEAMVGALLLPPSRADCVAGVVFFNNVGAIKGCIHGSIGVAVTLAHLGSIGPGVHGIETPVGRVAVEVAKDGATVTVQNVRSYRLASDVAVDVPGFGVVRGEIAWGGNWFFLIDRSQEAAIPEVTAARIDELTVFTSAVRIALQHASISGEEGGEIDHIEVFGPPADPARAESKNFVLCPGKVHDRSPCGTGTSAKLACLHAAGKLAPGQIWRQSGILDTVFEGSVEPHPDGGVLPTLRGSAYLTAEADLLIHPSEPFRHGIV